MQIGLAQERPMDVQRAQAEFQVAIANLQKAKADLETSATRSPIAGQVLKVHIKEGEQLGSNPSSDASKGCNGIAEIGKTDQMYAVADIGEYSIAKVQPGQRAKISSPTNTFPGEIAGTVESIGLQSKSDRGAVEVKVRLDDSRPVAKLTNSAVNVKIASP
ncbi:HlyD family efflux transporter periplasmic adaptor subunit [Kovacikia minuta CCNUW1]|uniref:HlyD family efflux transporter periplasmic adaptor subunit n=1 Tax=Kovacikia minuta TaxID=2931930 RepID=UPI001CCA974B|nr:HlyD family efflux transporter periplasmic adaptor subunit [Kovacikia minuta]UBF26181.1 HlyD family efflux transporter periplasmic adaptor subunit [Kovacikia minuta CCNUW1]